MNKIHTIFCNKHGGIADIWYLSQNTKLESAEDTRLHPLTPDFLPCATHTWQYMMLYE